MSAFGKPVCIVAAEVTRLKYSWESSIFMQRNEEMSLVTGVLPNSEV